MEHTLRCDIFDEENISSLCAYTYDNIVWTMMNGLISF